MKYTNVLTYNWDLAGAKRPANADVEVGRANKRSKMAPDAATIRAVQERINELEADQANSDDEFIGAFDDETVESDEHEDEIDQDIVVSPLCPYSCRY